MFENGLAAELTRYCDAGGIVIGTSAGAILQTPDISSALLCGDEAVNYPAETTGIGLVGFNFWPHYRGESEQSIQLLGSLDPRGPLYRVEDGAGYLESPGYVSG